MRYIILSGILLVSSFLFSQEEQTIDRKILVKVNPLGTIAAIVPVTLEYFFNPHLSASLNFSYQNFRSGSLDNTLTQEGHGIGPELRYYFVQTKKEDRFAKVYVSAQFNYEETTNYSKDRFDNEYHGSVYGKGAGLFFGHQSFFSSRFVLDLYAGPAFYEYIKNENYDQNITKTNMFLSMANARTGGTKVKIGFSLGIRF